MKFKLEIDMEKAGMGSGWTIANALREAAHQIESAHDSNRGVDMKHWDEYDQKHSIRAETGDTVGKWEVTEDAPSPADRAIVDALPSPADAASHAQVSAVLKEFMADVEAIGYAQTCKQWPDLSITYKKAKALNLNA